MNIEKIWENYSDADNFSGVFSVSNDSGIIFEKCSGFRNRSENLPNNSDTAFGIASGTKLFTGLAVCKLIEQKKLSLDDMLCDVLPYDLGQIDTRVTILHLLTHTSGIGDYIDEDAEDCEEQLQALNNKYPVYLWERLEYYLPMTTPLPPKFEPGTRFGYSNSGYVLLGLVIEAVSGTQYQQFVTDEIIKPCNLTHTGFYRMDALPANTAHGYVQDEKTEEWRTNIFGVPVIGGSDGGLFTCAGDLAKLWPAIFSNKILSAEMTSTFLKSHVARGDDKGYGLGVYICNNNSVYFAVGGDSGVVFFTAYIPQHKLVASALVNVDGVDPFPLFEAVVESVL